jgi:hypothetical protein
MKIVYSAKIEKRLVMVYSPILGTHYELRNVLIEEENNIKEALKDI